MVIGGIACTSLTVCALDLWVPLYLGRCVLLYISRCRYSWNPNKMTHYSVGCDPILNDRCYTVTTKYIYISTCQAAVYHTIDSSPKVFQFSFTLCMYRKWYMWTFTNDHIWYCLCNYSSSVGSCRCSIHRGEEWCWNHENWRRIGGGIADIRKWSFFEKIQSTP